MKDTQTTKQGHTPSADALARVTESAISHPLADYGIPKLTAGRTFVPNADPANLLKRGFTRRYTREHGQRVTRWA